MAWTLKDVTFDAETHTSVLPGGIEVPHVTSVLGAVRVKTDFDEVASYSQRSADNVERALLRGTAVHADCHAYDDDDLDLDDVDPRIRPYVDAWVTFRENLRLKPMPTHRERRVFHPTHIYTGILDGLFYLRGQIILVDIKTGDPDAAATHLQTAAYALALATEGVHVDERWAVWLTPGNRMPYRIVSYGARPDARLDASKWLACLTVYREQRRRLETR